MIKMELKRCKMAADKDYTIGRLYVGGEYVCDTLEPKDRGLRQEMGAKEVRRRKVAGMTAIPTGTYRVVTDVVSPRFSKSAYYQKVCGGRLPRLVGVQGFDCVLIHCGFKASHTAGCILVGRNTEVGRLTDSRRCFERLWEMLRNGKERLAKLTVSLT